MHTKDTPRDRIADMAEENIRRIDVLLSGYARLQQLLSEDPVASTVDKAEVSAVIAETMKNFLL